MLMPEYLRLDPSIREGCACNLKARWLQILVQARGETLSQRIKEQSDRAGLPISSSGLCCV